MHSLVVRDRRDAAERDVGDGNRKGNKLKGFDHVDRTQRTAENRLWTKFHFQHAEAEMGLGGTDTGELRFAAYVDGLASVIGHQERVRPLHDYCVGLILPLECN